MFDCNGDTRHRKHDGGFTLIEVLIVIVVLGILAGIVILAVGGISDRGQGSACKTDLVTLQAAEEAYLGAPPPSGSGGTSYGTMPQLVSGGFLHGESVLH